MSYIVSSPVLILSVSSEARLISFFSLTYFIRIASTYSIATYFAMLSIVNAIK